VAQRIASLLPAATEALFALGLGERIVGVSHACDEPPEARSKAKLTRLLVDASGSSAEVHAAVRNGVATSNDLFEIDRVALASAAPDLVVTQATCTVCAADETVVVNALRETGLAPDLLTLDPHGLDDVVADVLELGRRANADRQAEELTAGLTERIEAVGTLGADAADRPRVAVLDWMDPLMAAGHWVPGMVERVGGLPLFVEPGEASRRLEWDELRAAEPEVIVVAPCAVASDVVQDEMSALTALAGWSEVPAVLEGRVFALEGPLSLSRPGPGLIDAFEVLAVAVHPDLYAHDLGERAGELVPLA